MAKISIIVPVYNVEKYIEQCIRSIITQSMKDIEIILINDGSEDKSFKICEEWGKKDSRIKLINKQNTGVSDTRNVGITVATGEYIMFVDSDDWIEKEACEYAYKEAKKENADSVIFCYYREHTNGTTCKDIFKEERRIFYKEDIKNDILIPTLGLTDEKLKKPQQLDRLVPIYAKIYKNDLIKSNRIKYIDLNKIPSECLMFNFDYYSKSEKVVYIKKYLYHYRRNNVSSITKGYREDLFSKWLYWIKYMRQRTEKLDFNIQKAYYSRIAFSVIPLSGNLFKQKNFKNTYKELKYILNDENYKEAYKSLEFKYLPIHWKIYFYLAKGRMTLLFYAMSKIMRILIERKKK